MIRRNLPINETYNILSSGYYPDEPQCCSNCNKGITNIVTIENSKKQKFDVGIDCATTLSKLNGLLSVTYEFEELKGLLAKIRKATKEKKILTYSINFRGNLVANADGFQIFQKDIEFSKKYLSHLLKQAENKEKIGFVYKQIDLKIPFERFFPRDNKDFKCNFIVDGFEVEISVKPYFHMITNEISGYDLFIEIPSILYAQRCAMYRDILANIVHAINKHKFNLYSNSKH